ncbi:MAG TPA: erythromycin esterase family protein [Bacteroidales bacterium]|nr:erythromycin esterase family protein [Bacteroidales bacterium]HRZ49019.1 erythromycin esterase family protein [Bacteroidales bacterium]
MHNSYKQDDCSRITDWTDLMNDSLLSTSVMQSIPLIDHKYYLWLNQKNNHLDIRSLTSENFSDLQCLKNWLQNKTLIQLGESSHGTKEYSQIKVRLIKFLHEQMGFDVIAFESNLFECFYTNENIQNLTETQAMRNSIFYGVWGTPDVKELFTYIKETQNSDHPLILAGFDCQVSSNTGYITNHSDFLYEILSKIDTLHASQQMVFDANIINKIVAYNTSYLSINKDSIKVKYNLMVNYIDNHIDLLIDSFPQKPLYPIFLRQSLLSIISQIDFMLYPDGGLSGNPSAFRVRDSSMAANVIFLKDCLYPDKKIILWAHNYHIANTAFQHALYPDIKDMGIYLKDKYNYQLYTIGLYSLRGRTKTDWNWSVINIPVPTTANSLEALLYYCRKKSLFIDLENQIYCNGNKWMYTTISAKTSGFADENMIIKNVYDGVIFIDSSSVPTMLQ